MRCVLLLLSLALVLLFALAGVQGAPPDRNARATLHGAAVGYEHVKADAILLQARDNDANTVSITVTVEGLPVGEYGFHIHAWGDLSTAFPMDNAITGGHFNPFMQTHGCFPNQTRHVGDVGSINITDASAPTSIVFDNLNLIQLGGTTVASVIGRAMVIHAMKDDCTPGSGTTGTGNAGARIAQGVIGIYAPTGFTATSSMVVDAPGNFTGLAVMTPTSWLANYTSANGFVQFYPTDSQSGLTRIVGEFVGLPPNTNHSIHVHFAGDLSSADGSAAGAHYDPLATGVHDLYPVTPRHMGDIGNVIFTDENGAASFDVQRDLLLLMDSLGHNIVGRGVILHQLIDQGSVVPNTGGAGNRYMQGVIGISSRMSPPTSLPNLPPSNNGASTGGGVPSDASTGGAAASSGSNGSEGSSSARGINAASSSNAVVHPLVLLALAALMALML